MDKSPSDQILKRAVTIWARALREPKFDNGDRGLHGLMAQSMQSQNFERERAKVDYDAAVDRFETTLLERLQYLREHHGEETGEIIYPGALGEYKERYHLDRSLNVDYGPDRTLSWAAEKAGLPLSAFSWKSRVSFYGDDYVDSSFGYGAGHVNHYPLPDGRWLLCRLSGPDMPTIIAAVLDGRLPELEIEPAEQP